MFMRDATSSVQPAPHAVAMVTVVGAAAESYPLTSICFLRHLRCSLFAVLRSCSGQSLCPVCSGQSLEAALVSLCVQSAVVSLCVSSAIMR